MRSLRSSHRFSRTASLALSLAIALSGVLQPAFSKTSERNVLSRTKTAQPQTDNGKAKKVSPLPPEPGPSGITLPNLEQVRHKRHEEPQAAAPIESTIRSRRKSVRPPQPKKSHHAVSRPMATRNSIYNAAPLEPQSGQPTFTDDPLKDPNNPESFKIKALHITDLRTWINALRVQRGRSNYVWQKPTASGGAINNMVLISWEPIDEMRTALNDAIGPPANGYAPGLALNQPILAAHIQELRDRVKAEWGGSSLADQLVPARIDLFNQSGNQIEARDCEWGIPLVSLPGRAGLDLGISLTYSSLVWSTAGSAISFDDDRGDPSPGFKIGFPTIQGRYSDNQVGTNVYLLITSAGRRVELRRVGSSNVYEAGDSSYLQLIESGNGLLLHTTDGTQMSYARTGSDWHCTAIEDRNGNVINATYNGDDLATVTDTLGRVFYFNYDGNANLNSISQHFDGLWHTWASFGWGTKTLHPNFGLSVVGAYDGEVIPVLTQVGLEDGSHYNFEYNSYGQVNVIRRYTADGPTGIEGDVQRSYTAYDYDTATPDCPRVNAAHVWADNWNGDTNATPDASEEVITYFHDNGDGSHQMTAPDNTVYKEFYGTSWQHGLVTSSQVLTGSTVQKTTYTSWAQDNTSVGYQINPRVIETNVYDSTNHRRTTIDYSVAAYAQYGLPYFVSEYAANGTTEIRRTYKDYNLSSTYVNQRIIGLVSAQHVLDVQAGQWVAKTTYGYDQTPINPQATTAVSHDQSYGSSLTARGNVTSVSRWDVNNINTAATTASTIYDAAGSLLTTTDPASHATHFSYADSFSNDGANSYTPQDVNGNSIITFAYPTSATDADGYSTTVKYNYDFGAKTRAQNPLGAVQTFTYDNAERLHQATTVNTGAFLRHEYGSNYTSHFRNINNLNSDDTFTTEVFDGGGRVIASESTNPGSAGGYKAQWIEYDVMGRVSRQSNPTEIFWDWTPYGDDAAGRVYTRQTYDWKGRPLQTIHETDGTVKYASYAGCGCAGGEVVTLTDEVGRQQKVYSDILGRQTKTEILQTVNNVTSVYSTVVNTFNARDQITNVRQWAGAENGGGAYQDTTMSYDGYGRVQSKHVPEQQDSNGNPTYSTWGYKPDDAIESVTDGRGASATYIYNNNRHLVNEIHYGTPSGITPTANVTFGYDAAGNRTSMTDGLGTKSYSYNSLSQLVSETRMFTGVGTFPLSYDYNLAGELKKFTDATGMTINYGFDNAGRLNGVTGSDSLYAGVSNYASNFQYRSWGGLKAMTDGTGHTSSLAYNSKLQPSHFDISGGVASQNYDYYSDGRISFVHNTSDANFDRAYGYDHLGRLTVATTGGIARNGPGDTPYSETFGYDPFSHLTGRGLDSWNGQTSNSDSGSYTSNRRVGWGYDADGRNTTIDARTNTFDAAGQQTSMTAQAVAFNGSNYTVNQANAYDGDGLMVNQVNTQSNAPGYMNSVYYLRSTALGGEIVEELNTTGQKIVGYVSLPGGQLLATQTSQTVIWKHNTPAGTGEYSLNSANSAAARTEFDPVGADVSLTQPPTPPPAEGDGDIGAGHLGGIMDARWADFFNPNSGFVVDGHSVTASEAMFYTNFGTGRSMRDTVGMTGEAFANSVISSAGPEAFTTASSSTPVSMSGVEGTPGHQTIEWQWVQYNGEWTYEQVPTSYSGTASIPGSVVTLQANVQQNTEEHGLTVYLEQRDKRGGSYLNPCAMDVMEKLGFGKFVNLNDIRIHMGIPSWIVEGAKKLGGIVPRAVTFGNDIYFRSVNDYSFSRQDVVDTLAAIGHELTHSMQARVLGEDVFNAKYIGEWVKNGFRYSDDMDLEKKAYHVEELLNVSIPQRFGDDPCKSFRPH